MYHWIFALVPNWRVPIFGFLSVLSSGHQSIILEWLVTIGNPGLQTWFLRGSHNEQLFEHMLPSATSFNKSLLHWHWPIYIFQHCKLSYSMRTSTGKKKTSQEGMREHECSIWKDWSFGLVILSLTIEQQLDLCIYVPGPRFRAPPAVVWSHSAAKKKKHNVAFAPYLQRLRARYFLQHVRTTCIQPTCYLYNNYVYIYIDRYLT